jgi:hypothetical protein
MRGVPAGSPRDQILRPAWPSLSISPVEYPVDAREECTRSVVKRKQLIRSR